MKYLLLFMLFNTNSTQTILFNTPTNQYFIADVQNDPIQILVIEENIQLPVTCIQNKTYLMQETNFTDNSNCLMDTLNKTYDLNIQEYVDLKDLYTKEELLQFKKGSIPTLLKAMATVSHSYTIPNLYQIYMNAKKNEFQYEIHYFTYIKINGTYVPLAYPLNGRSNVINVE